LLGIFSNHHSNFTGCNNAVEIRLKATETRVSVNSKNRQTGDFLLALSEAKG